ncbi:MAG TPA: P-loop NTPase [Tetrasphaera sp.]|uniref:nucleotide-binding protein n=1 Tax=Nostocoides sp. TaxID=1917966 RepID=UPI002B9179FB|nr:P-loop NTPase [Tetrasphaera sp.]HNQ06295.1 P-loop NTPase [Tetrasphaera sp.]
MTLREFLKVVARWWPLIVASTLAAGILMWFLTPADLAKRPSAVAYTASSTLLVNSVASGNETTPSTPPNLGRMVILIQQGTIPLVAAKAIDYRGDPAELAKQVSIEMDSAASAITLTSTGRDGPRTAEIVNSFAKASADYFKAARPGVGRVAIVILDDATPLAQEVGGGFVIPPSRTIRAALAALLGLLVGIGLAMIFGRIDSRLRTREDVHEAVGLPIIAEVPQLPRGLRKVGGKVASLEEPLSVYAEGYRTARTAIVHTGRGTASSAGVEGEASGGAEPRVVLIASAQPSEGKTTSSANLAALFAETGVRVLVLDADLRSPDAHVHFDVPQGAGISDYVTDPAAHDLASLMRPTNVPGVRIITAGTTLEHPAALVSRMGSLLTQARELADVVIVDTAPLLAASDVFDLLPQVDVVVLVVRAGRLTESAGRRVSELLGRFTVPVAGVILVGVKSIKRKGYGYGYGYGYGSGSGKKDKSAAKKPSRPVSTGQPKPATTGPKKTAAAGKPKPAPTPTTTPDEASTPASTP